MSCKDITTITTTKTRSFKILSNMAKFQKGYTGGEGYASKNRSPKMFFFVI